jgi:hypothetical protein
MRIAAFGLAGAGVGVAVGGAYAGLQAQQLRNTVANAERNAEGQVVGLTRAEALELEMRADRFATTANWLFAGAAALAGAGVTVFLLSSETVVAPTPGGVAVSGRF